VIPVTTVSVTPSGSNISTVVSGGGVSVNDSGYWQISFGATKSSGAAAVIELRLDGASIGTQTRIPVATAANLSNSTVIVFLSTPIPTGGHIITVNNLTNAITWNAAGNGPTVYMTLTKLSPN
jgi:hypothetical protein